MASEERQRIIDHYAEAIIASPWMNRRVLMVKTTSGRAAAAYDLAVGFVDARYAHVEAMDGNVDDESLWAIDRLARSILLAPSSMQGVLPSRLTQDVAALVMDQAIAMNRARETWISSASSSTASGTSVKRVALIPADDGPIIYEQGVDWVWDGVTYHYAAFGVDGAWFAIRTSSSDALSTGTGQSGTKPSNLTQYQAATYGEPAYPPIPAP